MAKSTKQLVKDMKDAKKALHLSLDIGNITYKFDPDVFDLDHVNLPNLSEQIGKIPGHVGYIIEAVGEAEKYLAEMENKFEIWKAQNIVKFFVDLKAEKDKLNNLISSKPDEYNEFESKVQDARKIVAVLKAYSKGIEAKFQLAQTLSANIRVEADANRRNYDKSNSGSSGSL